ncbi:MAG: hypothetical protein J6D52_02835, partial [Clostridia bacterium]|nr:hypothetical protein [Clostridia bacterium]
MDFKRDVVDDSVDTDFKGIKYAVTGASNSEIYEQLIEAAERDDEEEYQKIYKHLLDNGKSDSDIMTGIKKSFRESNDIKKETKEYLKKLEDNDTYNSFDDKDKQSIESKIASELAVVKKVSVVEDNTDKFDILYKALRTNRNLYEKEKQKLLDEGLSESRIKDGIEMARIAYMKSIGIDVHEYLLFKIATSVKNADANKSGRVDEKEKNSVIDKMDISKKTKNYFKNNFK